MFCFPVAPELVSICIYICKHAYCIHFVNYRMHLVVHSAQDNLPPARRRTSSGRWTWRSYRSWSLVQISMTRCHCHGIGLRDRTAFLPPFFFSHLITVMVMVMVMVDQIVAITYISRQIWVFRRKLFCFDEHVANWWRRFWPNDWKITKFFNWDDQTEKKNHATPLKNVLQKKLSVDEHFSNFTIKNKNIAGSQHERGRRTGSEQKYSISEVIFTQNDPR